MMDDKNVASREKIIIGTAPGDFHGLGKKILTGFLKANMFRVVDLGLNVKAEKFIHTALMEESGIIGISSMMVHTALGKEGAVKVRNLLDKRGLSSRIKLIVGGAPFKFDDTLFLQTGADAYATDAITGTQKIKQLLSLRTHDKSGTFIRTA